MKGFQMNRKISASELVGSIKIRVSEMSREPISSSNKDKLVDMYNTTRDIDEQIIDSDENIDWDQ